MELIERIMKYKAHRVRVYEDKLLTPDGETVFYDFVENRNGSGVLLIDDEGKLLFVKQYRNSINAEDIEIPAGCAEVSDFNGQGVAEYSREDFENSENPYHVCALRESEEETGYIPEKLYFVNYIIASVGLFSERTAVYIGYDLKRGKENPDSDEFIDIIRLSIDEALEMIYSGKIHDSKTILAILAYKDLKERNMLL